MTGTRGMIKPPSNPPLRRTVPGADPPTITQYCLDPLDTDRVLGSQTLDDLVCGEFRVTVKRSTGQPVCAWAQLC
jgi:hypothetical protein